MRPGSSRRDQIQRLESRFPLRDPGERAKAQAAWDRLAAGIKRLSDAGVAIGAGTDGGGQQGDQFIGWTMHAELENLVMAGIPPARALVAATKTAAAILGQDDLGRWRPGRAATSSCSTPIPSTTSPTPVASPRST
jgi:imidazolonepropionase-like amidohydrolase